MTLMTSMETAVASMVDGLLAANGQSCTYIRGGITAGTITLSQQRQTSISVDNGNGGFTEIYPVDFVGKTDELLHDPPVRGDRITVGGETFEVMPTVSEKVFRRINNAMTRIHTKQIPNT